MDHLLINRSYLIHKNEKSGGPVMSTHRPVNIILINVRGRPEISSFPTYEITSHKRGGRGSKKCRQSHSGLPLLTPANYAPV